MNATDRLRSIGLSFDLFGDPPCFHKQMLFERCAALSIDACCFLLAGHLAGGHKEIQLGVNFVNHRASRLTDLRKSFRFPESGRIWVVA